MPRTRVSKCVFDQYEAESPIATELRRLYHNIRRGHGPDEKPPRSFLITSSKRQEGKSTISSFLGVTIAHFPKRKVLMIDADLRRPRMHTAFDVPVEGGLGECLRDEIDPMKLIKKTRMDSLDIMTAGERIPTPALLFESEILPSVLEKLQFYYDIVIVDSAPVVPVSDTLYLAPHIGAVLFVVLAGVTPQDMVMRGRDILVDSGANVGGVIVNNVSQVLPYYYDYDYYGYEPSS